MACTATRQHAISSQPVRRPRGGGLPGRLDLDRFAEACKILEHVDRGDERAARPADDLERHQLRRAIRPETAAAPMLSDRPGLLQTPDFLLDADVLAEEPVQRLYRRLPPWNTRDRDLYLRSRSYVNRHDSNCLVCLTVRVSTLFDAAQLIANTKVANHEPRKTRIRSRPSRMHDHRGGQPEPHTIHELVRRSQPHGACALSSFGPRHSDPGIRHSGTYVCRRSTTRRGTP